MRYVACTTAVPAERPVTTPVEETVATAVSDDCHVAWLDTSCVPPLANVAVAVNCDVAPTAGAAPETVIDDTELGDVGAHAAAPAMKPTMAMILNTFLRTRTSIAAARR